MNIHEMMQAAERDYAAKSRHLVADHSETLPELETRMVEMHKAIQTGDHAFWFRRYFQGVIGANFFGLALAVATKSDGASWFAPGCVISIILLALLLAWAASERYGRAFILAACAHATAVLSGALFFVGLAQMVK